MFNGPEQNQMAKIEEYLNTNYDFPSKLVCIPELSHSKRVYKSILMDPYVCPFVSLKEETKNISLKSFLNRLKRAIRLRKEH